jgi:hypothetical protein
MVSMNPLKFLTTVRRERRKNGSKSKEGVFVVERRKHPRISIEFPFEYSGVDDKEIHGGISANASEGGLLVYLPEPMEIGTIFEIEILFVKGPELSTIKAIVKVVWSDLASKESWGENRYGLHFQSFREGDIHKLKNLLAEAGKTHERQG